MRLDAGTLGIDDIVTLRATVIGGSITGTASR